MDEQPGFRFPPAVEDVAALVTDWYEIGRVTEIRLLRSWTHAVFGVTTTSGRYVLKCYRPGWRTPDEIGWEVDLLDYLDRSGVRVAPAIRGRDGEAIRALGVGPDAPLAVLFPFAPGEKPRPPFPPELYEREGRAVATMHAALDTFRSSHHRPPLDLAALLDGPLVHVLSFIADAPLREDLLTTADVLRGRIEGLAAVGLDWGPCHGDLTFDNLHLTDDGAFAWYDFDSGGPGWRALDIQGWTVFDPVRQPLGEAFVAGYRTVRPLGEADLTAAPLLTLAQEIWSLSLDLRYHTDQSSDTAVPAFFGSAIPLITDRLALLV